MKKCSRCKVHKDVKDFHKNKCKHDGLSNNCKSCCRILRKIRYEDNDYRNKIMTQQREYYSKNKEKAKEYQKNYQKIPKNRKRKAKLAKDRIHTDLNSKIRRNLRIRVIRSIERGTKSGSAVSDLGCSVEEFKKYIESLWKPCMNWDNWGSGYGKWQLDHIMPLFNFDLTNRTEFLKACHYTNMQPLWYEDHIIKGQNDRIKIRLDILKKPC